MVYRICSGKDKIISTFSDADNLIRFINTSGFELGWHIEVFRPTQYGWAVPVNAGYIERES